MGERKTSEIKMRVTPSFKARVQSAAAKEDVSMSEWLEQAAEQRMEQRPVGFPAMPYPYSSFGNGSVIQDYVFTGRTVPSHEAYVVDKFELTERPDKLDAVITNITEDADPPDLERQPDQSWKFRPSA